MLELEHLGSDLEVALSSAQKGIRWMRLPHGSSALSAQPTAAHVRRGAGHSLFVMRAVQITRFGGPEVLDLSDPTPGDGEQLYDISSSGVSFADTHHRLSLN